MEKILPKSAPQTCRGSTSGQEDSRVRTFLYLADKEGLPESEALSFLKSLDSSKARLPNIDPNGLSLKMLNRAEGGRKIFPVTASDGKALIQLIGGTQGKRVYDPAGISCTLTSEGGGFAGRTGMYFIDLCKGNPKLTENARCIKARYDGGVTNRTADNSGVLCISGECPDRTEETALIQLKRGKAEIREQNYTKCLIAGYNKIGVSNRGESSGVF